MTSRMAFIVLLLAGCADPTTSPARASDDDPGAPSIPTPMEVPPQDDPSAAPPDPPGPSEPAEPEAPSEAPPAEAAQATRHVDQRITIVNPTTFAVRATLTARSPDRGEVTVEVAEIAAGGTGTATIPISSLGSLLVVAHWTSTDGSAVDSRPFTVDYTLGGPITACSLTLSIPMASGRFGTWNNVTWADPPPAH